jgi:hypothetical protein
MAALLNRQKPWLQGGYTGGGGVCVYWRARCEVCVVVGGRGQARQHKVWSGGERADKLGGHGGRQDRRGGACSASAAGGDPRFNTSACMPQRCSMLLAVCSEARVAPPAVGVVLVGHHPLRPRVVPRRPHRTEGVGYLARHDGINRGARGPCCRQRRREGAARDCGVAVQVADGLRIIGQRVAHSLCVCGGGRAGRLGSSRGGEREAERLGSSREVGRGGQGGRVAADQWARGAGKARQTQAGGQAGLAALQRTGALRTQRPNACSSGRFAAW